MIGGVGFVGFMVGCCKVRPFVQVKALLVAAA